MSCAVFCLQIFSIGFGHLCRWTQPKQVPGCFLSSLTRVCFEKFEGLEDELKMVEYFLKNARVLRTMEIYTSDLSSDSKLCLLKKLSMFRRSSETCQLSFNWGTICLKYIDFHLFCFSGMMVIAKSSDWELIVFPLTHLIIEKIKNFYDICDGYSYYSLVLARYIFLCLILSSFGCKCLTCTRQKSMHS